MEADSPGQYLSAMTKKARKGKIFVDYLRNARGATAIAAYSTRARMNAPIATPIRWEELGPGMTPSRFNVSNIGRRLAALKEDPWEGFFSHPQRIDKAALHVTRGRRSRSSATL
jgi:bifunctional non-homologous end joining protein LigD